MDAVVSSYNDFQGLAKLRAKAEVDQKSAAKEVGQQFEAFFIQMMLKSMRDATVKSDLFDSSQMDTYQSMADQQLAVSLAESGGIGLARMMVEQMQSGGYVPESNAVAKNDAGSEGGLGQTDVAKGIHKAVATAYEVGSKD